jgi:NAD dependent epimerase/dehydratase
MKKKIFLTGAEGFIGSHLLELLVKKNYKVKALCLYNSFNHWGWLDEVDPKILKEVEIISGDIRDKDFIYKNTKDIDIIINLAALIAIPYSYEAVESFINTNIIGLNNILSASLQNNCKVIHTSTSEVYGEPDRFPISEKDSVFAKSPYSATKIAGDQLCFSYYRSFGLPVTLIRPFNTFGPRQSLRAIIPTIITQAITNNGIIKLGNIYPKRNFNYVKDIINGFEKSIKLKKFNGELINLGGSFEISIKDLVKLISKIMNKDIIIKTDKKRYRPKLGEVNRLVSSKIKSKKILNWIPKYDKKAMFEEALSETIDWYFKNISLYKSKSKIYTK